MTKSSTTARAKRPTAPTMLAKNPSDCPNCGHYGTMTGQQRISDQHQLFAFKCAKCSKVWNFTKEGS